MNKVYLILFSFSILCSCKSPEDKLKEKMLPIIKTTILQDSVVSKLDSLVIYKIDTLTDLKIADQKIINASHTIDFYTSMAKSYFDQAELEQSNAKIKSSEAEMYLTILDSRALGMTSLEEAKNHLKESQSLSKQSDLYRDSAKYFIEAADKMEAQIKSKKLDSVTFKGYVPHFKVLGATDKNVVVKKDSMIMFLSPELRIIPPRSLSL